MLFISICLIAFEIYVCAAGTIYKKITEPVGDTINEESVQQTVLVQQSLHLCSRKDTCYYVAQDTTKGTVILYDTEGQLPQSRSGLRIWKKVYVEPLRDCKEAYYSGHKSDGVYSINIPVVGLSQVRCDMTTSPGGWIVFQRRVDGTVSFDLDWANYKRGFGNLNGNFWLGLEKIHQLAGPGKGATLRVDLKHMDFPGEIKYVEYSLFEVSNEADGYKLRVGGYSGNGGDSFSSHDATRFTAKDKDLDSSEANCAVVLKGGWWFTNCYSGYLNGIYPPDSSVDFTFMSWQKLNNDFGKITFSEMKIKF